MKVLYLSNYPSPYRVDFFNEIGKQLSLTVLFSITPELQKERDNRWFNTRYSNFQAVFLGKRLGAGKKAVCLQVLEYLKQPYDLIVLGGYSEPTMMLAIEYLKARKIPFCMEIDGGLISADGRIKSWLKRRYLSAPDAWLSSGKVSSAYLTHYGAKAESIYEYPFTSMWRSEIFESLLSQQQKRNLRQKLGITEDKVIISVGQFIYRKGFDILLRAASQLGDDVGVYIVGGKPTEEYLALQQELNLLHVHFVGFTPKQELAEYFDAADVFAMPTRRDVWGLVVSEAMAHGLPVVSTDQCVAGMELVRDGENGYIVPVDDPDAMADALLRVLNSDVRGMGQSALDAIRGYSIEDMVQRHVEIFEQILKLR